MFDDFYYMTLKRVPKKADLRSLNFVTDRLLWPPYVIGGPLYFGPVVMVALCNRADHYIFARWLLLSSFLFLA